MIDCCRWRCCYPSVKVLNTWKIVNVLLTVQGEEHKYKLSSWGSLPIYLLANIDINYTWHQWHATTLIWCMWDSTSLSFLYAPCNCSYLQNPGNKSWHEVSCHCHNGFHYAATNWGCMVNKVAIITILSTSPQLASFHTRLRNQQNEEQRSGEWGRGVSWLWRLPVQFDCNCHTYIWL